MTEAQEPIAAHAREAPSPEEPADQPPQIPGESRPITAWADSWWRVTSAGAVALFLAMAMLAAIWFLARPLVLLVLGITIAESLSPVVVRLERRLPRIAAILFVYILLLLIFGGIGALLVPTLLQQVQGASDRILLLAARIEEWLGVRRLQINPDLLNMLTTQVARLGTALLGLPLGIVASILDIILVFFSSIYWLIEKPTVSRFCYSLFPAQRRHQIKHVVRQMGQTMGGFVRGTALDGLIVGILTYIGLLVIGVNYALVLSLFAGVLEIIPTLGPVIAAVPILIIALLQSPTKALLALIFMAVLHQVEGNILLPNIMRNQTKVSPLLVILALFAGGVLGGLLGALVAIPLSAALRVLALEVVAPLVRRWTGAEEAAGARESIEE